MNLELTEENTLPIVIKAAIGCLANEDSSHQSAWRIDNQLLVCERSFNAKLKIGHSPLTLPIDELLGRLIELNVIKRSHQYVLSFDAKFHGRAQWSSLLTLSLDTLKDDEIFGAPSWTLHAVADHPFMAMEKLAGRDAKYPRDNAWHLGVLLLSDPKHVGPYRPSVVLPTPHAVIATYHGDPSLEHRMVARSIGQ